MAGETALARQLKKLSVPQTSVLLQDKIRKSFLFDHRDAAGLDREVIFAFGTNGLQKLCTLNPLFSKFETDLFSVRYKDFQRSVQTSSVNKKLDAKISEFLRMLSPYFLIRDAHEALEWLIYRFQIHLYNVDKLIASVIPHYNTSTFVRVVQLLDLDETSRWFWLKSIQKTGVHLEYSAILNRFLTDNGFRKLVCDTAPNVLSVYKDNVTVAVPIISFSMSTIYNSLEKCVAIEDKLITSLFPYVLIGLKSDLTKYTSASYMVISKLLHKVKLNSEIVKEILIKIFQTLKDDLVTEACKILILTFQVQMINTLPQKVFSILFSNNQFMDTFFCVVEDVKSFSLIKAIIKKVFAKFNSSPSKKGNRALNILSVFLNSVTLNKKCVVFLFNITIKTIIKCPQDKKKIEKLGPQLKIAKFVFKKLEENYPDHFDKAYKRFFKKVSKTNRTLLCNIINTSVCGMKYKIAPDKKTSLAVGLYHVNPQIRQTSTAYLLYEIANSEYTGDQEFVENSLNDRLFDDNPEVILEILSSLDIVLQIIDRPKLLRAFETIFAKGIHIESKWYSVQIRCLDIIIVLYQNDKNVHDVIELILNFVFPVNEYTLTGFLQIINSDLKINFIQRLKGNLSINSKKDISNDQILQINHMIITYLKRVITEMSEESKIAYASMLNSKIINVKCNSFLVFYVYAMQFLIETSKDRANSLLFMDNFLQVLKFCFSQHGTTIEKFEILSEELVSKKCVESLNKKCFPMFLIYNALYKVATSPDLEIRCEPWPDVNGNYGDSYEIVSNLFNFCIMFLGVDKGVLKEYFDTLLAVIISHHLKSIQIAFWFLSTKFSSDFESPFVQYTATNMAIALIQSQNEIDWLFNNSPVIFSVIKATANPISTINRSALCLLSLCMKSIKDDGYPLKLLGDEIIRKSEEIKIDYRQCTDCISNWLKAAVEYTDAKSTRRVGKELNSKIFVLNELLNLLAENRVPYSMKYFLMSCLQNADSATILNSCIPILCNYINLLEEQSSNKENILNVTHLLIKKFTPKTAVCLTENCKETESLLGCLTYDEKKKLSSKVVEFTLNVLNEDFFAAILSIEVKLQIFEKLLSLYMTSPLSTRVGSVLRDLCPHVYLFIQHFNAKEFATSKSTTLKEAKKSNNTSGDLNLPESDTLKKIIILLELMQNVPNFLKKEILIPELFDLLHKIVNFVSEDSVEYIKQLILSAIHNCYEQLSHISQSKVECDFRVEIVTLCIRTSTNPKTHNQALLLLNLAATMFPDRVLENLMSIFVFMGSNLIRQDDAYSFQVLSQIIETIMPSLLEASNQQTKTDGYQVVASVIRVFVDSLLDIPGHRQLPMFTKVITTLDPSKYLWIPLGQICDQYASAFHDITIDNSDNSQVSPPLEFAVRLHQQFSPHIQIDACISLIKFLMMLPDNKRHRETNSDVYEKMKEPFNVMAHNDKQLQMYKLNILCFLKLCLSSPILLNQIAELSVKQQSTLEEKYEQLLESALGFLQSRLKAEKVITVELKINDQVQLLYDLVNTINSLLPCNLFIQVMRQLLKNTDEEIQLRAIELLNKKLEQQQEMLYVENRKSLLKLLKPLMKLVNACLSEDNKCDRNIVTQQTALYSLHLLCKLIGSEYPTKFFKVLKVSVAILTQYDRPELIVNALLCIAQLCRCLNVDILPHLNAFMPIIINILQDKLTNLNESLIFGIIAALNSIIENLGIFLSSYMEDIVINICLHSVSFSELGKKAISDKFVCLQTKLANEIPVRVLIGVIEKSYSKLCRRDVSSVVPLMNILTQNLESSKYDDILSSATELQNIYLSLLDFRNSNQSTPLEIISSVENSIILCLQTFVMKLSVTRFRTFFQKIYQWVTVTNGDQDQKLRIFTFYKMTNEFSKSLKSLFAAMSRYFFTHVSSVLVSCNTSKSRVPYFDTDVKLSHEFLINVLDTLNYCFMYAEEQLLDKEHFELLMQPLVDQVENLYNESLYQELLEHHLNSCIAHFMAAVSDGSLWKSLNYQILLKTRHDSPKIRFGALQVIREVVNKMGDNYLMLLPESIPFLAEIMEDESSEVEQECQTVIMQMEKTLGEPIRNYF